MSEEGSKVGINIILSIGWVYEVVESFSIMNVFSNIFDLD